MISAITQAKAQSISFGLSQILGSNPIVTYKDEYAEISFTPEQKTILQRYINRKLTDTSGKKSDIQINFEPVIYPILIKKVLPYAIGLIAIGFITGKIK